jgi:hypothetical protein
MAIALAWFNYISLAEAYDSGPPYDSRSTNMHRWANPLPLLPFEVLLQLNLGLPFRKRFRP